MKLKKGVAIPLKILAWVASVLAGLLILVFVGEKLFFASFFFGGAKIAMRTPGTWTNYVQQGFDHLEDGTFIVSARDKRNDNAALYLIKDGKETLCQLKNTDGTP